MTKNERTILLVLSAMLEVGSFFLLAVTIGGWPTFAIFLLLLVNNLSQQVDRDKPSCSCRGQ